MRTAARATMLAGLVIFWLGLSSCSVMMAAQQPGLKPTELFSPGTPRSALIVEFGNPFLSETRDGKLVEVFKFVQGYHTATKAARMVFHTAADVFSFGAWEILGTPTEMLFNGEEWAFEVTYDAQNRIETVTPLITGGSRPAPTPKVLPFPPSAMGPRL